MRAWITKAEAITLVWRDRNGRRSDTVARACAHNTLGWWRRRGDVRTKPAPELRQRGQKHDPVLYRRVDVVRCLSAKTVKRPGGRTSHPGFDPDLERLLRAGSTRRRRFELGIATLGGPPEYAYA